MISATGMKETARFLAGTALIVCCLTLAGCSTGDATRSREGSDIVQSMSFWQPYLLYILASPHPRLYVEVDAVEGCAPSDRVLNKLRDFLTTYCNKPGGIEIGRSDVIPIATARGILPNPLARKYLDGPPDDPNAPSPAFMYVLYYSGALSDKHPGPEAGHAGKKITSRPRQRNVHPHADFLPYPAIIFMNKYFHFSRFILGWQRRLCKRCVAELADSSRQAPPSNLCFVGPVLVRSENGYHILSLPRCMRIVLGDLAEQDCRDFAAGVRAETPAPSDDNEEFLVDAQIKQEVLDDPVKMRDIINRVKNDPYEAVRGAAAKIWSEAEPACTR